MAVFLKKMLGISVSHRRSEIVSAYGYRRRFSGIGMALD